MWRQMSGVVQRSISRVVLRVTWQKKPSKLQLLLLLNVRRLVSGAGNARIAKSELQAAAWASLEGNRQGCDRENLSRSKLRKGTQHTIVLKAARHTRTGSSCWCCCREGSQRCGAFEGGGDLVVRGLALQSQCVNLVRR